MNATSPVKQSHHVDAQYPQDDSVVSGPETFWSQIVEQRREQRLDFRTTGYAYAVGSVGMKPVEKPIRIWTVDVSTMGALVRSYEPIPTSRVLVELVMPQLAGSLIEAKVVRASQDVAKYLNGKQRDSYLYGLEFSRIIKRDSVQEELQSPVSNQEETSYPQDDISNDGLSPHAAPTNIATDMESGLPIISAASVALMNAALILLFHYL